MYIVGVSVHVHFAVIQHGPGLCADLDRFSVLAKIAAALIPAVPQLVFLRHPAHRNSQGDLIPLLALKIRAAHRRDRDVRVDHQHFKLAGKG